MSKPSTHEMEDIFFLDFSKFPALWACVYTSFTHAA